MSEAPKNPANPMPPSGIGPDGHGLDAAQQSLSDALRVSFGALKFLMVVLVLAYIASGFEQVDEQTIAVRYRLGERVGIYGPGYHFGLPVPIDKVLTVPQTTQTVSLNESFWYDNPDDLSPEQLASKPLNPISDSFLITGDGNVVHVQFEVKYQIDNTENANIENYLRNVGTLERADQLVRTAAERGMIFTIASTKTEDIIRGKIGKTQVAFHAQQVLTELKTGITVQEVLIDNKNQSMPNQVRAAYEQVTQAEADKVKAIQEARRTFDETLGQTAGGAHTELLAMVRAYEAALANEQQRLAKAIRVKLNDSIGELRLPSETLLDAIGQYHKAVTAAAGGESPQADQALKDASSKLQQVLENHQALPADQRQGRPIAGEIASAISIARANRSQITTQARLDFERYASALDAYNKTPLVLANDRLQATREKVMGGDVLVQTFIGELDGLRLDTNMDPEVQEEIAQKALEERRRRAREAKENE